VAWVLNLLIAMNVMLAQSPTTITNSGPIALDAVGDFPRVGKKSAPARVLVVDDEPLVRWSVGETLGARGYDIVEADDAASVMRAFIADRHAADLVLLDYRLPDSNDLKLLAMLRGLAPHAPIILMTAYWTRDLTERALHLGAFTVLAKPFEMNELAPLVVQALSASRPN
jgi:two-component system, NtrC family, response regulator AtoC